MNTTSAFTITVADDRWDHGRGPWDHDGGPPWPVLPIAWFLILLTAAILTILMVRNSRGKAPRRAGETRLAEEYAAGKIDADEYRTRLQVLRGE